MKSTWFGLAFAVASVSAFAAEIPVNASAGGSTSAAPEATVSATAPAVQAAKPAKIIGGVELRPSYRAVNGNSHTENYAQLGYQFPSGLQVLYRQEFNTNLSVGNAGPGQDGLNLYAFDGSFRAKVGDFWKSGSTSLNYEARAYVPTFAPRRDAGMVTAVRNYIRLKQKLSSGIAFILEEVPIVHVYSKAGVPSRRGGTANPAFENRVYLDLEIQLPVTGLKLFVPLMLASTKHRDFAPTAKNNDAWAHKVTLWPELTYGLSPNMTLGLAFATENLIKADFSGLTVGDGFKNGMTQLILSASL